MPNYLVRDSGRPEPANVAGSAKENSVYVDDIYKSFLYNQDKSIMFVGKVPEDFAIALSGNWGEGFDRSLTDMLGGGALTSGLASVGQAMGLSSRTKILTARTWESPSYLSLSLPISLYAYKTTEEDVLGPMKELLKLCAPSLSPAGTLVSPGPVPLKAASSAAGYNDVENSLPGEILTLQIGKWFRMSPCVVQSVNENIEGIMEHDIGNPMSVSVTLEIESYFCVTKDDIDKWFRSNTFGRPG